MKLIIKTRSIFVFVIIYTCFARAAYADTPQYTFGVIPQHTPLETAQVWNPILAYISTQTRTKLILKIARSGDESRLNVKNGLYDFVYTNHTLSLGNANPYTIIARPNTQGICGELIVPADSPISSIHELNGKTVCFPSKSAFVGYVVTVAYLHAQHIDIHERFGATQEGAISCLYTGFGDAVSANDGVIDSYTKREKLAYRTLWRSHQYNDIPISVHKRVNKKIVQMITHAFITMIQSAQGKSILHASAKNGGKEVALGFVRANDNEYTEQKHLFESVTTENKQ